MSYNQRAIATIDGWMSANRQEFYPNWPPVVPARASGGWATIPKWRQDGSAMVEIFEVSIGHKIDAKYNELDKLRTHPLNTFREYLVRKANAAEQLDAVKALFA